MQNDRFIQRIKDFVPIIEWLPKYKIGFLKWDLVAGITLASFVLPESMAYATLAGLPTYFGIYCCLAGGFFFAFFTTSKQVAIGPTSAISLMVGTTLAVLSGGDPAKWAAIAALTALVVAGIYFLAFACKLSSLVSFISDSILLGFKAGAALSIISTQLPKLFGVEAGGSNFFIRIAHLVAQIPVMNLYVLGFGIVALLLLIVGEKTLPGKPVSLVIVIASIIILSLTNFSVYGIHVTGFIPSGLPQFQSPTLQMKELDGVLELALACFLMGFIETISAAKTFAIKNGYQVNSRQELLSLGFANLGAAFFSAYVVSGGLSQTTINDKSGAKTPLAIIICSVTLAVILLFFTHLLSNLPEVILAVIVLHAVAGLIKIQELKKLFKLSKIEFGVAMIAILGVLVFGILKGVMLAVIMSLLLLIKRISQPNIAVLGKIGETNHFSDIERHPDNIQIRGILILRIEASILYFNSEFITESIYSKIEAYPDELRLLILDMSPSSYVDVGGSKMLLRLSEEMKKKGIQLEIVEALSTVRDILRKIGLERVTGKISRMRSIEDAVDTYSIETSG